MELSSNKQKSGKRSAARWPFFLIGISLVVLLIAGGNLLRYYGSYREETELNARLQQIRTDIGNQVVKDGGADNEDYNVSATNKDNETGDLSPEERSGYLREAMAAINPDYVGWLELTDTTISYPVVFRDNEYYINHDFEQKFNSHGAIFLDETCDEESLIWLIHGHHMKDGTMFAGLSEFKSVAYLEEHTALTFDAGEGAENYRIYAAALIDFSNETELTPAFHYERLPEDEERLRQWQNSLKKYSFWYNTEAEAQLEELAENVAEGQPEAESSLPELLVLSTCEYGTELQRLIVVAVKDKGNT